MPVTRRWFQFHLLTAIVLMLAAALLLKLQIGEPKPYVAIDVPNLAEALAEDKRGSMQEIRIFRISYETTATCAGARDAILDVFKLNPPLTMPTLQIEARANALVARGRPETLNAMQSIVSYYDSNPPNALLKTRRSIGWPFSADGYSTPSPTASLYRERIARTDWTMLAADAGVALAILLAVGALCEYVLRRCARSSYSIRSALPIADSV